MLSLHPPVASEKDAKLVQKLGQLQPFIAVFPLECMGRIASFGPTLTPFTLQSLFLGGCYAALVLFQKQEALEGITRLPR